MKWIERKIGLGSGRERYNVAIVAANPRRTDAVVIADGVNAF
jgi:hypothetical protein